MTPRPPNFWKTYRSGGLFFEKSNCERCGGSLEGRIMSWFTEETICLKCSEKEDKVKEKMRKIGMNPDDYEGLGYIPRL